MPRLYKVKVGDDGWSEWQAPAMVGYRMGCCDCGLVHTLEFRVVRVTKKTGNFISGPDVTKGKRVLLRARRNNRSTAAVRRKKK